MCDLKCGYCFYHDTAKGRTVKSHGVMTEEIIDVLTGRAFDAASKSISFMFQGGEPTLAGLDYFRYFVEQVNKLNKDNKNKLEINYAVQTNGINISEELAIFFKKNNFLVGLSLDGVKETNDYLRVGKDGEGTFGRVIKTSELFDRLKIDYNILTVVNSHMARHIEKIYNFYKRRGFDYLQFIPCLEPLRDNPGSVTETDKFTPYGLTPEIYEKFLVNLFTLWYGDFRNGRYISIRFFDNLVRVASGEAGEQCGTLGFCSGQFVVESDGSVYPCDFYCVDNWKLGNISDMTFEELHNSPNMRKFRETSVYNNYNGDNKCKSCKVFYLCRGGCRRDRDEFRDGFAKDNKYCGALYNFYCFAEPYIKIIAENHAAGRLNFC